MTLVCERHRDETGLTQPGMICPSCLREKLAQLTTDRNTEDGSATTTAGFGVWSDVSPGSSCHQLGRGSDVERPSASVIGEEGLRKSSSVSVGEEKRRKKKKGFWSKLTKMTWQK